MLKAESNGLCRSATTGCMLAWVCSEQRWVSGVWKARGKWVNVEDGEWYVAVIGAGRRLGENWKCWPNLPNPDLAFPASNPWPGSTWMCTSYRGDIGLSIPASLTWVYPKHFFTPRKSPAAKTLAWGTVCIMFDSLGSSSCSYPPNSGVIHGCRASLHMYKS